MFEEIYLNNYNSLIGADEAGRGPLVGPVFACAVKIENKRELELISLLGKDSKKLTEKERERRYNEITKNFIYSVKYKDSENIDLKNIFVSSQEAINESVEALKPTKNNISLIDGKSFKFNFNFECIIKGDDKSSLIGAASIIAKVSRDRYMINLSEKYEGYFFETHKGYPTRKHVEKIKEKGIFEEYRITFNPVKKMILDEEIMLEKKLFSLQRLLRIGVL